ncbi:MAG: hypothetical protein WC390_03855 [Sulfurimonas sp.]
MKIFLTTTILAAALSGFELIHVSNHTDEKSLTELSDKYKKEIIISNNRAYLVPSECLLVRHFGGLSQNRVEMAGEELQNGYLATTQEVFEAKDAESIKEEIKKQKISDTIEAKVAKAFLDDADGHLFGGLSQGSVDLGAQKEILKKSLQEHKQQSNQKVPKEDEKSPTCIVSNNGSGYILEDIKDAKLYKESKTQQIVNGFIPFN